MQRNNLSGTATIICWSIGAPHISGHIYVPLPVEGKGLRLKMWYHDSLAGKVRIEGDADMQAALTSFIEATEQAEDEVDVKYVTLHAEDCIDPDIPRKRPQSDADACPKASQKRKR